ncbi:hypothetical protein [Massilia sp. CF038]|uniref:hypothetical protein n=1 Tax=Massilia sp. CF038 TaxID=1881045 RepID=UPI0009200783|nr:hypothetical protein [Massilia sp. CF038]SHH71886.1 hypothetical protein SAMN05428948_5095 [Massilia sp. CF038]
MSWGHSIRQGHRTLSILFTLAVVANFAARAMDTAEPSPWITYAPLPPRFLMLLSGLYLFALPYVHRRGSKPGV